MNPDSFGKPKYTLDGIYRGLVEDNNDPEDSGRVKIRIFGIHDIDTTTIDQLPWAKPALSLYWSGGYNVNNLDHQTNPPPKQNSKRYDPGAKSKVAGTNKTASQYTSPNNGKFKDERIDPFGNACGTGGQFVVPKRGNWVFVFFEAGNHMNPVYFAMAPMARDWSAQKTQRNTEIKEKIDQISEFKKLFQPRTKNTPTDNDSWAPNAVVSSSLEKPKLLIDEIDQFNSNRDIFCTTTAQGTTLIIDNRLGKEKIYVIHKNSIDYVDSDGNKKLYIGKSHGVTPQDSLDKNIPCNYEIGVEGNHELHVIGEYNLYAKQGVRIQCDGNAQIDVKGNVGLVSQEGDVDVIIKKGNLNADIKGNADINIQKNANIKVNNNANIKVNKNLKATVNGTSDFVLKQNVKITSNANLDLSISGNTKLSTSNLDITTSNLKVSGNCDFGQNVKIRQNLDVGQNLSVGQFAYVLLGINCGGTLINRGLAELGSPCILHTAAILPGMAPGIGKAPQQPSNPSSPEQAKEATREPGEDVVKKL